ncbi:MAG: DUF1648 domain-containing protein [Lachnospiraceae bacterium]
MNKPYIKKSHVIAEIASYLFLLAAIVFAIVKICTTDGQIPTHWDLNGEIDGYGSPVSLLIMPLIMFFANLTVSICIHLVSAESWNLPCKPKPGRELIIYSDMVWMMVWMQIVLALFTMIMTMAFTNFPVFMGACVAMIILTFVILIAGIIIAVKHNK